MVDEKIPNTDEVVDMDSEVEKDIEDVDEDDSDEDDDDDDDESEDDESDVD